MAIRTSNIIKSKKQKNHLKRLHDANDVPPCTLEKRVKEKRSLAPHQYIYIHELFATNDKFIVN